MYKNINPNITDDYTRTFKGKFNLPVWGLIGGTSLFAYGSYFNFSVPTRLVLFAVPIFVNYLWRISDVKNQQNTLDFLNWVIEYRKARCYIERAKTQFNNE